MAAAASLDWWLDFNASLLLDVLLLNDTGTFLGNESASSAAGGLWDEIAVQPSFWCLLLLVFPTCTVFGNALVCLSIYQEKALHTVTNYFIASLAIADIMVAILVMPLAVYVEVRSSSRPLLAPLMQSTQLTCKLTASSTASISRYFTPTPAGLVKHNHHHLIRTKQRNNTQCQNNKYYI